MVLDELSLEIHECERARATAISFACSSLRMTCATFQVDEVWRVQTLGRMQSASNDALRSWRLQHDAPPQPKHRERSTSVALTHHDAAPE